MQPFSLCVALNLIHISTAPVMRFPMNLVNGNKVIGSINGTLEGGTSVAPGIRGNALYMDGQAGSRVDYGVHSEGCFFDPDQCDNGVTFSIWVMLQERVSGFRLLFNNGGCVGTEAGFCFYLYPRYKIGFRAMGRNRAYIYNVNQPTASRWDLFIMTFVNGEIKMFVNGCIAEPNLSKMNRSRPAVYSNENSTFRVGDATWSGAVYAPHAAIDELMVWYRVLTVEEIWALYTQGGSVWCDLSSHVL